MGWEISVLGCAERGVLLVFGQPGGVGLVEQRHDVESRLLVLRTDATEQTIAADD